MFHDRAPWTLFLTHFSFSLQQLEKQLSFTPSVQLLLLTNSLFSADRTEYPDAGAEKQENNKKQWGGCSDDIKFGEKETRRFIDKLEKGNDARTAFNLHNNQVGRKVGYLLIFFSVSLSVKNVNSNLIIITVL